MRPVGLVHVVVKAVTEEISQGRAPGPAVITFFGEKARYAKLINVPDLHVVARGLVHQDRADAVVVILPTAPPEGFGAEFAFGFTIEAKEGRLDRYIVFRNGGSRNRVLECELPDQRFLWLDAGPDDEIGIAEEGPVGMVGPTGDA